MITLAELKKQFPNPAIANSCRFGYCVGGALCLAAKTGSYFPGSATIAGTLVQVNPELDWAKAHAYASDIIYNNDKGRFDTAWSILGQALSYRRT